MFDKSIYQARRNKLKAQVGNGVILLLGNEESSMNYRDNLYPFRQDSSFLYFFGLDKPGLTGIIDIENNLEVIYGRELTMDEIVWTGPQPSISEQAAAAGITVVRPVEALTTDIVAVRSAGRPLHFLPPYRPENSLKLTAWLGVSPASLKGHASVPLIKAIVAQRSIKSAEEIVEIEQAVNTTAAMHLAAMKGVRAGMTEAQLAGGLQGIAIAAGGNLSFPTILTVNGQVLHNHYGPTVMKEGRIAICDSGAENAMHYAGDMTRTFPVGRRFTSQQREMYDIVLGAQEAAIAALRPGVFFRDVHALAAEKLMEGLKQAGVVKGDPKEAVAAGAHTIVFQCGLGHMMGLDVHDMEDLGEEYVGYTETLKKSREFGWKSLRLARELEPGFVVTIEPGLYFIPELMDQYRAEKKYMDFINYDKLEAFRSFGGIRIEDDLLVIAEGSRILGKPLVKKADEVEALRESV
ncbi:aminopeptidase P family protein [Puia dinghuensis]|uniref:Xaa-Pro aminopeptidase n=1 Tax=Puia dinghuensis TaxID=1792502 RepID=A0A8J2UAE3_9BACT|nr:aminopeptidase P family protein [Puia dinghuensis]GGA90556.1 Xaa-Pro aminopeptidase [Puia dinghuensis]